MKRRRPPRGLLLSLVLGLALSAGCGGAKRKAVDDFLNMSPDEALEKGEKFFAKESWEKARTHFSYAYESGPNSPAGRRGLLRVADTHFEQAGDAHFLEASYKYRDFLNRFPGSEETEYVMFQIANSAFERREKPDRDQTNTAEALKQYRDLLRLFPQSQYAAQIRERMREAIDHIAEHEYVVAKFYRRRGSTTAAISRWLYLLETYPEFSARGKVYSALAAAYRELGNTAAAERYEGRLAEEFPGEAREATGEERR